MDHASQLFGNDQELFNCITAGARRSIPDRKVLMQVANGDLLQTLKRAIEEHGIEAFGPDEDPGLNKAYKSGFLHASFQDPLSLQTLYTFPTILHHR